MKTKIFIERQIFVLILACAICWPVVTFPQTMQVYDWQNVVIKGGGLVPGIIYSKAQANLIYARTDVGGAYRFDVSTKKWVPLTDFMTSMNNLGVVSLAADPSDANRVYLATGLYIESWWSNNAAIYASNDQGNTWAVSSLPFKLGGNDPGRGSGERLQVDPNLGSTLYLGTNQNGLWKSADYGATWNQVSSFPGTHITFVAFDKSSGTVTGGSTKDIYVGVCDHLPNTAAASIYKSSDGGSTWAFITGQPTTMTPKTFSPGNTAVITVPNRIAFTNGNYVYVSYSNSVLPNGDYTAASPANTISNGAIFRYDKVAGTWTELTAGFNSLQGGFSGITVHPTNPDIVVAGTAERWWHQNEIHISTDAGTTWNTVLYANTSSSTLKATISTSKAPWASASTPHWICTVEIDPFNPDNIMFGTGYGIFACYNFSQAFSNNPTSWEFENDGLEETVPLDLVSPPSGPPLLSALGDIDGFRHDDLTVSPPAGRHIPRNGTNTGIAFAESNPDIMARTFNSGTYGAYSSDGGVSWTTFSGTPPSGTTGGGHISISSNGTSMVWAPSGASLSYSTDNGATWTASSGGVPNGLKPVADRVTNNNFYIMDAANGRIFRSNNAGVSFSSISVSAFTLPSWDVGSAMLVTVFGKAGHIWATASSNGLYYSTDAGSTFTKISSVSSAYRVAIGAPSPTGSYPAIFIAGQVGSSVGLFRSDDMGSTWFKINDSNQEFGRSYTTMAGDPRIYGRLYLGTQGRGILYGDISTTTPVEVIEFKGSFLNNDVNITWQTINEKNIREYHVLRSDDLNGNNWIEINVIKVTDNYSQLRNYFLIDYSPPASDIIYYKLIAIENNGKVAYSNIIAVSNNDEDLKVNIFPNPTENYFTFFIPGNSGSVSIKVFDLTGVKVEEKRVLSTSLIKVGEDLPGGIYFAEVQVGDNVKIFKILKK